MLLTESNVAKRGGSGGEKFLHELHVLFITPQLVNKIIIIAQNFEIIDKTRVMSTQLKSTGPPTRYNYKDCITLLSLLSKATPNFSVQTVELNLKRQ